MTYPYPILKGCHKTVTVDRKPLGRFLKGVLIFTIFFSTESVAQTNTVNFQLEAQAIATSPDQAPFWFRARQGGSVPLSGLSGSLVGHIYKDYGTTRKRTFDWGIGVEGRANGSKSATDLILVQANAKIKLAMFEIRAGRWRGQAGLTDTLLTSGLFLYPAMHWVFLRCRLRSPSFIHCLSPMAG